MLSWQDLYTQAQDLAQDDSDLALVFLKRNINLGIHRVENALGSFKTVKTGTRTTTVNTYEYDNFADMIRPKSAYLTVGTTRYPLILVKSEDEWQSYRRRSTSFYNDAPTHIYFEADNFEIYPGSQSAGNVLTVKYEAGGKDLQYADYTDGNITTLANGGTVVTGSGTTFTQAMVGRWFKIDADGDWYKILTYTSATSITLDRPYQGTAISAGSSAYTIGEMPIIPSDTHMIPVWYALEKYFRGYKQNNDKANEFKLLFKEDLAEAKVLHKKRYTSNYIPGRRSEGAVVNPNEYPQGMS